MNTNATRLEQIVAWLSRNDGRRLLRILTAAWTAFTAVHITIWGLIWAFSRDFEYPWWLWPVVPSGIVLTAMWWLTNPRTLAEFQDDVGFHGEPEPDHHH